MVLVLGGLYFQTEPRRTPPLVDGPGGRRWWLCGQQQLGWFPRGQQRLLSSVGWILTGPAKHTVFGSLFEVLTRVTRGI